MNDSSSSTPFRYTTQGGVDVERWTETIDGPAAVESLVDALDDHRGVLFTSTYEYPGRYTRWDMGFIDPPLEIDARGRNITVIARNERGRIPLAAIGSLVDSLLDEGALIGAERTDDRLALSVNNPTQAFTEEERTRQPSVFSVLRRIIELFRSDDDATLGLYGSFGYDLTFQFEPVEQRIAHRGDQRDLVLFLPDEVVMVDRKRDVAHRHRYELTWDNQSTARQSARPPDASPFVGRTDVAPSCDHEPGEYAATVMKAKEYFRRGDLFEVVPGQVFSEPAAAPPSEVFRRLRRRNPAPYGALMNLGDNEYLIAASPEMYVRVEGNRVETCPISGTIARGDDVLADAENIRTLLNSSKDESELTMCTDVDRNDKSRVCDPASIRIIGRRQIETYSRLFHTVDHVEGTLLPQFDGLDAFLTHTWAVTVTGAPKLWAMRFIEEHEKSRRAWYGGAIGALFFNGNVNTGLTLRTIHVRDGVASVRAGATLLMDSEPEAEELETRTKASALLDAIRRADGDDEPTSVAPERSALVGKGVRVLLVDHEDSFVHTLAGYFRRTGADVVTLRVPVGERLDEARLDETKPDLVVISPGPGKPEDFHLDDTLTAIEKRGLPVFGVCLGLQGIVEHYGGELATLGYPAHGRRSKVTPTGGKLFAGLPEEFMAGRYHSLYALEHALPDSLQMTALSDDGVVMAVEHTDLPIAAVQFHPESIMTLGDDAGMTLIENVIRMLVTNR